MVEDTFIKCIHCNTTKHQTEFFKSCIIKHNYCCKSCAKILKKENEKNPRYLLSLIYNRHKHSRHKYKVCYTKEEFIKRCVEDRKFKNIFETWKLCNYMDYMKPCVIRKDSNKDYTLDNILFVEKNYVNEACQRTRSRRVSQLDDKGNVIAVYPTAYQASIALGLNSYTGIIRACKRPGIKSFGHEWRYA